MLLIKKRNELLNNIFNKILNFSNQISIKFINIIIILLLTFSIFSINLFNNNYEICNLSKIDQDLIDNSEYSIQYSARDVYLTDSENRQCFRKIVQVWENRDSKNLIIFIGTNLKIYNYLSLLLNTFLLFSLYIILLNKSSNKKIIFKGIIIFVLQNLYLYNIFLSFIDIQSYIRSINLFIQFLLIFIILTLNNNLFFLLGFIYFTFFDYEGLKFFIIFIYLFNKFKFNFNISYKKIITSIPIIFYFLRFISGTFQKLNLIWLKLSQNVYETLIRFTDTQQIFLLHTCNRKKITFQQPFSNFEYSCPPGTGYGPLVSRISFETPVWFSTLITVSICYLILLIIYYKAITKNKENYLLIVIFSISPPVNMLLERMNVDIYIILFVFLILYEYKLNYFFQLSILLVLALYKIHPIGIIVGFLLVAIKHEDRKRIIATILSLLIFIYYLFIDYFVNDYFFDNVPTYWRFSFGFFQDVIHLTDFLFTNKVLRYPTFIILVFVLIIFSLYFRGNQDILKFVIQKDYIIVPWLVWITLNLLYTNYSYRIAIFIIIYYLFFYKVNNLFRIIFLISIYFNPISLGHHFYNYKFIITFELFLNYLHSLSNILILIFIMNLILMYLNIIKSNPNSTEK